MKELSIKEKAKAYDEALERARIWQNNLYDTNDKDYADELNYIFPELKEEPEDEKIRKALINVFATHKDYEMFFGVSVEDIRTWLEKQKIDKEINLAEILKHYPKETELYSPLYGKLWLAEVDEKNEIITCYKHPLEEGCTRAILPQEDTVSFYSNGTTGLPDYTVSKDCMLFLYNIEKQSEKPTAWSEKDEETLLKMMFAFKAMVFPSSEECNSFIDFLKSLKNKVQPKQKWSDEDECYMSGFLNLTDD